MVKVPLKRPIILITELGDLYCTVEFAGKDTFKISNIKKRVYTDDGDYIFVDIEEMEGIIDRHKVIGYLKVNQVESLKQLNNNNILSFNSYKKGNPNGHSRNS
jgi:hypothetical protein